MLETLTDGHWGQAGVHQVIFYVREVLEIIFNQFPDKNWAAMKYNITNNLLDGLHLVLVIDVFQGVQHVPEALEVILNWFPFKH